ncbi:hypothetical protein DEA8626_01042 [Defluviimonas aquaemixtae]|uniref:DUF302 domain-containing protein n=1 Tax=Albidovulum aquaemixtae TaxID=1542388 RepID=A0A2R8B4G6_9RHOB|nr:DUF302 domain-containing protein [Defluviimonas aquaemixtae]SPH17519.1 hypothetical protein DEA8626_01042 [Defluviimonas aquaemixtae]
MKRRQFSNVVAGLAALSAIALVVPASRQVDAADATLPGDGIVRAKSAYPMADTIDRITDDLKAKNIILFDVIDQAKLGRDAGIDLNPSALVVFGNPPLGAQFLTAKAESGLDWPVRLLVFEDSEGQVWMAYTDFQWIARRHNITNRVEQFAMASEVIASIVSSATH